ncbi:MAG: short-chain dehydrogenase/reductase [Herbinix sp.]|nr:short-chain dehydrogenase/reductase [Herbinix sp.]
MGKNISIVTGATGGLGREFVKLLLQEEVDEIWVVARNIELLNKLRDNDMLRNHNPVIQFLINNAGGGRMGAYHEFSKDEIAAHVMTHCTSAAILCNLCIPYMQRGSHIINMASQSAFQPVPYINLYAASKAFVRSYSRALNVELKKTNLLESERNGKQIHFPAIALPEDVAIKIMKDAKKGKDMSVYGIYVKYMHLLAKVFPHKLVMKTWLKQIKDYI